MNYAAILHRPLSEFAHATKEDQYVFCLRAARNDITECVFCFADRADMAPALTFARLPMPLVRRDLYYDWFEITLRTEYSRIAYYFILSDGHETLYYAGDCLEKSDRLKRSDYFQLPYNLRCDRISVPDWVNDAVVYNIFPDSFASERGRLSGRPSVKTHRGEACLSRLGGTINGIVENLEYIRALGVNCLYLNPIFAANAYHKYDVIDYYHIDPARGTDAEFLTLVKRAHDMGMRVIVDGVFNHVSWRHPFFQDVLKNGARSRYYDWFYQLPECPAYPGAGKDADYACFAYVPEMPKTNTAHIAVRAYFIDVGVYWIEKFGVDGWRLDVANEMDEGFLRAFRGAVKNAKGDAVVIGEVWENANRYLLGGMLDGAMNYDFRRFADRFFARGEIDAAAFDLRVSQMLMRYPRQSTPAQLNLLDSHDVSRFLTLCAGDRDRMTLAILFQMTFIGMPCVFYGDEKGLSGTAEEEYRQGMDFAREDELERVYREMTSLRNAHPALRRGAYETLAAEGMLYAYRRRAPEETIDVYLNAGDTDVPAPITGRMLSQKGLSCGILGAKGYAVCLYEG